MSPEEKHYLVSIVTVTKNCGPTIARTLESVRSVKSHDVQYVVVDGESTDGTLDIIRGQGDLVDILISEKDSGIYNAMNKGAAIASGQYILFLNGDDRIVAEGFNRAKVILDKNAPELLACQSEVFAQNGSKDSVIGPSPWLLLFFNSIPHLATFVSAELQKKYKFRETFRIAADYDLFLRMFLKGHHFTLSKLITSVHYRGGFSNNLAKVVGEIGQIRKDNLGAVLYSLTRGIERLNKLKKAFRR